MPSRTFSRRYPVKPTAKRVLKRHSVLYHLSPGRMDWADLQFVESEILLFSIRRLGGDGIPALPIHDSIIVKEKDKDQARMRLSEAFYSRVGSVPVIEEKG